MMNRLKVTLKNIKFCLQYGISNGIMIKCIVSMVTEHQLTCHHQELIREDS